jgi:DNA-binding PadR family transcriptional regulator
MHSKELLKGTLKTIILSLLEKNGRMYGYEITRQVKEMTGEEIILTEGALYPALHKLEAAGLVLTEKVSIGKRVRKYYYPTESGREKARQSQNEFWQFVQSMKLILKPKYAES